MQSKSVFDKLVFELSSEERLDFLHKAKQIMAKSSLPLVEALDEDQEDTIESELKSLGFFKRIFFQIIALLQGQNIIEVLEDYLVAKLGKEIQGKYPKLLSAQQRMLQPGLYNELKNFAESVSTLHNMIEQVLGVHRNEYMAYLLGIEMPDIQDKLIKETDPEFQEQFIRKTLQKDEWEIIEDREVKKSIENSFEDIIDYLPVEGKRRMYGNARFLEYLRKLAAFPYDRILKTFTPVDEKNPVACSADRVKKQLFELCNLMYSGAIAPSFEIIESLFMFSRKDNLTVDEQEFEAEFDKYMDMLQLRIQSIRDFSSNVPLLKITRFSLKNLQYFPKEESGGEDWLFSVKQFWQKRIFDQFSEYSKKRKKQQLIRDMLQFLDISNFESAQNYFITVGHQRIPGKYYLILDFLKSIFVKRFPETFAVPLKILLIDGDFYKEDNRLEFTDAYNSILQLPGEIEKIEEKLSPGGEVGQAIANAEKEMAAPTLRKKKALQIMERIDIEVSELAKRILNCFNSLILILDGVIEGESGGQYDTLANKAHIQGRKNKDYLKQLGEVRNHSATVFDILERLIGTEV